MIGNVWEWTDARVPDDSWTGKGGSIGELMGTNPTRYGHDALYRNSVAKGNVFLRGGGRYEGTGESEERGCFNLALGADPEYSLKGIGFRCCADPE
jgi:formylglycine-generating enzyme required for sulfatase activity